MIELDRVAFVKVIAAMAEMKRIDVSAEAYELWWDAMQEWSIEDFKKAARLLIKTSKWMPQPSDFEDLRKAGRPTAGEAWAQAVSYASSSAYRRDPNIGVDLIDRAVRMIGGYAAIGMWDEDNLHFIERLFCEHYEAIEDRDDIREQVPEIAFSGNSKVIAGTFKKLLGR